MSILDVERVQQKPKQDWENLVDSTVTSAEPEPSQEARQSY